MKKNQKGFSMIEGVIVVVVVVVIGALGYYVYQNNYKSKVSVPIKSAKSTSPAYLGYKSPTTTTQAPPTITSATSLNEAYSVLNQTSVSSNNVDSSQLSTQASNF